MAWMDHLCSPEALVKKKLAILQRWDPLQVAEAYGGSKLHLSSYLALPCSFLTWEPVDKTQRGGQVQVFFSESI
ncbi:hypothetical protein MRB53_004696 [Persea americana]|uniref:Uncharacterized protein n=1 Tax=Persea americana TaxID=3435 RepID=A0ACC2MBY1_PERAE|nr:hypothetical protein MRB53_004696 [Persea americana]